MPAPLPAGDTNLYAYAYDPIGNRQNANALNQYASVLPSAGTLAYDADGNMISTGTFTYSWDAENRLVEVQFNSAVVVQNAYDFMGRRITKSTPLATTTFLCNGCNLLRESSISNNQSEIQTNTSSFVWGLDLSGSLQGADGVGGLLCQIQGRDGSPSRPLFSFSDANGNLTDMSDTNGTPVAHYDYGPFGETISQTGSLASENPFRFSTKYQDDESGLYCYGYRFYSPELGRWISRDPLGEEGGSHLYQFVFNNSLYYIDPDGAKPTIPIPSPGKIAFCMARCAVFDILGSAYDKKYNSMKLCGDIKKHCENEFSLPSAGDLADRDLTPKPGNWKKAANGLRKCLNLSIPGVSFKHEAEYAGGGSVSCNGSSRRVEYSFDITLRVILSPGDKVLKEETRTTSGYCGITTWCKCCQ